MFLNNLLIFQGVGYFFQKGKWRGIDKESKGERGGLSHKPCGKIDHEVCVAEEEKGKY